jgi:tripeptide aminopeptidase
MASSPPRADLPDVAPTAQQDVARLASSQDVRSAFTWLRSQEPQLAQWQMEMARIAAPPFGESARAAWLAERFREVGLEDIRTDDVGNVFGVHRGLAQSGPAPETGLGQRYVALSAHIDTVFPASTPLNVRQQGSRLYGPGVSDNGAGVTAMLAIAASLHAVGLRHALPILFIGNVGEEGEGDLRGMRHIFSIRVGRTRSRTTWCSTVREPTPLWLRPWAAAASKSSCVVRADIRGATLARRIRS